MKNKRWLRLIGWLLALVMILSVVPTVTFAEGNDEGQEEEQVESGGLKPVTLLLQRPAEVDITESVSITYTDAKGKAIEVSAMDPNASNTLKLKASGLNNHNEIIKDTVMAVTLPENITVTEAALQGFSSNAVTATLEDGKLLLSWKDEKQDSLEATVAVLPHLPTDNDLSGSYVLGTARKSMLGTRAFTEESQNRDKLYASEFTEINSKIHPGTDENPIWVLEHVTGDYYTLRAQNTNNYIYISPVSQNGYKGNSLYLVAGTSETAQKILVTDVGGGYYSFTYTYNGKKYAINNSGNDKAGNSAIKGFGCYTYAGFDNEIFKLYSPSALDNNATKDLSGTWIFTNTSGKVSLTSESSKANCLNGMTCSLKDGVWVFEKDAVVFTFEHVIRDWYTVRTDAGYLNIAKEGVKISSTPQRLLAKSEDNYETIILTTGEYLNSSIKTCPTYALNYAGSKSFGSKLSKNDGSTRMLLIPSSGSDNADAVSVLSFNTNGGTVAEAPETITGEEGEKVVLPAMDGTKNGNQFIGWCEVDSVYKQNTGTNHTYHTVYKPGASYTLKAGTNTLYAIYNDKGTKKVRFGIRKDGVIQDEPNGYKVEGYVGHFEVDTSILKETHWVIDIDSTKPVNEYYVENNVTANLNWVPSAEQIAEALRNEGNIDFDPETQYIHYYVIKCIPDTTWKIDGVIRNKAKVSITYDTNVPAGVDKTQVSNMPGGYQTAPGTDVLIGADENSNTIKRPSLSGYYFMGWNTEKDGTGKYYSENSMIHLKENLYLYAQWTSETENPLAIKISSSWPSGKVGYVGARITLTAELTGFEGREYVLQWQYTTNPDSGEWIDAPDAHDLTYTYILNEETTHYTWRVVAQDIR